MKQLKNSLASLYTLTKKRINKKNTTSAGFEPADTEVSLVLKTNSLRPDSDNLPMLLLKIICTVREGFEPSDVLPSTD